VAPTHENTGLVIGHHGNPESYGYYPPKESPILLFDLHIFLTFISPDLFLADEVDVSYVLRYSVAIPITGMRSRATMAGRPARKTQYITEEAPAQHGSALPIPTITHDTYSHRNFNDGSYQLTRTNDSPLGHVSPGYVHARSRTEASLVQY
jgi:hypothetical protein